MSKSESVVIDSKKHLILDLEGKTLTTTASDYVIKNYGDLEIIDSSEEKTGKITSTTTHTIYNGSEPESQDTDDTGDDESKEVIEIPLKNVKKYNETDEWVFKYDESTGKLKNTNNTHSASLNTVAKGYIELDLTPYIGKYTLEIDTNISTYSYYGDGYVSISNNPDNSNNVRSTSYGNILDVYGVSQKKGTIDIAGGQKFYINFQYEKSSYSRDEYDDEFTINSITLTKKQEGKLTLTGGTISIEKAGWWNRYSDNVYYSAIKNEGFLNINGGNITSSKDYTIGADTLSGGTSNISGGNFTFTKNETTAIRVLKRGGVAQITGGKIDADHGVQTLDCIGNAIITGGEFSENCYNMIYNYGEYSLIKVKGITLNKTNGNYNIMCDRSTAEIIIEDCEINYGSENNVSASIYCNGDIKIYRSKFTGLVTDSYGKVYMENVNINTNNSAIDARYKSTIDINKSTITVTGTNGKIINGDEVSSITISDSTFDNTKCSSRPVAIYLESGTINIKGDTSIKSENHVIYSDQERNININIESGTFDSTNGVIYMKSATGNINIGVKDGQVQDQPILRTTTQWAINANRMNLNFYDGELIGTKEQIMCVPIKELEDNKDLVSEVGEKQKIYKLGEAHEEVAVVKNINGEENLQKYDTLQEAIAACKEETDSGQITIRLLKDIDQEKQVKIENGQNIKLDLNGYKFYAVTENAIYNEGILQITNSKDITEDEYNLNGCTGATIIKNAKVSNEDGTEYEGKLTIGEGIKIYYTASGISNGYKQAIRNDGDITINNTPMTVSGRYAHAVYNAGSMNMSGGKITLSAEYSRGIYNTGKMVSTGVNIEGTGNDEYGIHNYDNGNCEVNGGTISITGNYCYGFYNESKDNAKITGVEINCKYCNVENYSTGTVIIDGNSNLSDSGNYNIYNQSSGTIKINEATITGNSNVVTNANSGTIDILKATIKNEGYGYGIYNSSSGTVYFRDGEVTAESDYAIYNYGSGIINVTGGTVTSNKSCGIYNRSGTVIIGEKIADDRVNEEEPSTEVPSIKGTTYGIDNRSVLKFYDGAITGASEKSINGSIAEKEIGYQIVKRDNNDGTETATLEKVNIIEIIGEQGVENKFSTIENFQEKMDALEAGKAYTVKVLADFSMDATQIITIPQDRDVIFDINGHSIASVNSTTIQNNGNLTIEDNVPESTGRLSNAAGGSNNSYKQVINNGENATLTITSGKIVKSGQYGFGINNCATGTVIMNGGIISTSGEYGYGIYNLGNLSTKDGEITTSGSDGQGIYNLGTIDIDGLSITTTNYYSSGVYNNNPSETAKIKNTNIITEKWGSAYGVFNEDKCTVEVNEGTVITSYQSTIYNDESAKTTINGATLTSTSEQAIYNNKGTIELKEATVTAESYCIYNTNGTVNIADGTITSEDYDGIYNLNNGNLNITGGTITSKKRHGINNRDGVVTIGEKNEQATETPVIKGVEYGIYNGTEYVSNVKTELNFYDGSIIGAVGKSVNPNITDKEPDYQILKTIDGKLETATLQQREILEIDGTTYQTIPEAKQAVENITGTEKHTIKILSDTYMCLSENITIPENTNFVLNLNGHSLESSSETTITNKGNLEITDESDEKNGKILGTSKTLIKNEGNLTATAGTIDVYYYSGEATKAIYNDNKIIWKDGTLQLDVGNNYGIYNVGAGTIEWESGNLNTKSLYGYPSQYAIYTESTGTINWKNGTIYLYAEALHSQFGFYIKGKTGDLNIENVLLKTRGCSGRYYESNQYLAYSNNDNTDKNVINVNNIEREVEWNSGYSYGVCGKKVKLNIIDGNFSEFNRYCMELDDSEINIKGGTCGEEIRVGENSTLVVDGGTIEEITNSGETIINNGTISQVYNNSNTCNTIMNGGTISNSSTNAVEVSYGTFTLLGGTIESTNGYGVHINYSGIFTMGNDDYVVHTNEPSVKGSNCGVYRESGTFNFYDGVIEGRTRAINGSVTQMPENYQVTYEDEQKKAYLTINSQVEKVVSIGDKYFKKLETAINNANIEGGTLIIHGDLTIDKQLTIENNKPITINLNGHNLNGDMESALFVNQGNLTIIDEIIDEEGNVDETAESVESTIENKKGYAIENSGTLTLGKLDGKVNEKTPNIKGEPEAIDNQGTLNWYDGKINGKITSVEQQDTQLAYVLSRRIMASAENILKIAEDTIQTAVQSPKIKLDSEWPIWTQGPVKATIYTTDRIILDIVNQNANVETRSLTVKKVWEMPDEEAQNYKSTIQLMKIVNGKKEAVTDKEGRIYTVEIIGNNSKTFQNIPVYKGSAKIEYALEEIKVQRKTAEGEWEDVPMTDFNVTYKQMTTD